jgi:DNA-binding PadR family transcriptional regulator
MSLQTPMSPTDFHVLLVLSQGALYGYAIKKALEEESGGAIDPEIGSLYRVIARLVSVGFVEQAEGAGPADGEVHPGRQRKYYALTPAGERALREEAARLQSSLKLAESRGMLPGARF